MPKKSIFFIIIALVLSLGFVAFSVFMVGNKTNSGEESKNPLVAIASQENTLDEAEEIDSALEKWRAAEEDKAGNLTYEETLSATDELAREFFTSYIQTKQSGGDLSDFQADKVVSDLLESENLKEYETKPYKENIIKNSGLNSEQAIRNYGNKVGEILISNTPKSSMDEFEIMTRFYQTGNLSELKKLKTYSDAYRKITEGLLEVEVPSSAVNIHLNFLNSTNSISNDLKGIQLAESDPVLSILGISNYDSSLNSLTSSYQALQNYFVSNNISFSKNETGYTFLVK